MATKKTTSPAKSDPNALKVVDSKDTRSQTLASWAGSRGCWKPWEQSTGPKTPEGKARVSRNAWQGGHRQQLRELIALVNAETRSARELVAQTR